MSQNPQSFQDREIICRECKTPFVFTAGEAQYFTDNNLFPPARCKSCRANRKAMQQAPGVHANAGSAPAAPAAPVTHDDGGGERRHGRGGKRRRDDDRGGDRGY